MAAFDAFYPFACKKLDLTEKPVTGGNRGGLPASLWTIRNSDEVSGVYLDVAVMNILSWPGKNSRKRGSAVSKRWGSDK